MSEDISHKCPVQGCNVRVVNSKLMCPRHWRRVSADTAKEVYAAFKQARGSKRHFAAMRAAVVEAEGGEQGALL